MSVQMDKHKILLSPEQPAEWRFIDDLRSPQEWHFNWSQRCVNSDEVDLSGGIFVEKRFPDPDGLLDTAYADLNRFFTCGKIALDGGIMIVTELQPQKADESYTIAVSKAACRIIAADIEGVRRGIYYLEDLLLGADGPFLKVGEIKRSPWVKNRISRCFFGPIKRPPLNRDELLDEVDYYPKEYLNRLAHEGINGLWLTIKFSDLCKTSITPEYGKDAAGRLAKLRITVDQCLRYGIKTYIFCIEPAAWRSDSPVLKAHPELGGAKAGDMVCFCPFSATAGQYLYEAVNGIFKAVPRLGGMINISHGERATTCLSNVSPSAAQKVDCPVCSGKKHWEIIHAALSSMEKGMRDAAPDAQLISWLYMPQPEKLADWVFEIPGHVPDNVILQSNFESGGTKEQLGKTRVGGDYWLSYVGPCDSFRKIAESAVASGTQLSAKIQVGCSHEVATVPFVPVPALLYRKYQKMHELGVSSVMQCWYFGNYPGIMNKAAGMLAFEDFEFGEKYFLKKLALPDWGQHANAIVEAWTLLADGYANYPLSNMFQYYGPMHDGVVWPLYLYPAYKPLAPTWKLEFGTSGDFIGECLENHTIEEAIILCREMSEQWNRGVKILNSLRNDFNDNPDRLKDIGLAEALGIQFESGYNILRFYALREQLFNAERSMQKSILNEMEMIVMDEIGRSERLIELCENDSRLGFHSEAEGYKYFPEKLKWRITMLKNLLAEDFSIARLAVIEDRLTCPAPANVPVYTCNCGVFVNSESFKWKASSDARHLIIEIDCEGQGEPDQLFITVIFKNTAMAIIDLYKSGLVGFSKPGCSHYISDVSGGWNAEVKIPAEFGVKTAHLSIIRLKTNRQETKITAWGGCPLKYRLLLGMYNPQAAGMLILNNKVKYKSDKVTQFELQMV